MTVFEKIKEQIKHPESYSAFYIEHEESIQELISTLPGVKTDLFIDALKDDLDFIRFCSIFSDLVNIYPQPGNGEIELIVPTKGQKKVTLTKSIFNSVIHNEGNPILLPAYFARGGDEMTIFFREIEPLIERELAIVHNARMVMGLTETINSEQPRNWQMFNVSPNSPTGNWLVMEDSSKKESLPISFHPSTNSDKKELFDITIPYLKGISFKELSKILLDNSDLLSSFRKGLKELIEQSKKDGKHLEEIKNDIIKPNVDKISFEFNRIQNIHKLKVSGTVVSMITLGLVSFATAGIGQIVASFLGTGGLGLLVKNEVEYQEAISKLTNNPLYLMWELKRKRVI